MTKEKVKVMFNTDVEKILTYTRQYDDFLQGNILCQCCGRPISEDNVSILLPIVNDNGEKKVVFWCNNDDCISNYRQSHGK